MHPFAAIVGIHVRRECGRVLTVRAAIPTAAPGAAGSGLMCLMKRSCLVVYVGLTLVLFAAKFNPKVCGHDAGRDVHIGICV